MYTVAVALEQHRANDNSEIMDGVHFFSIDRPELKGKGQTPVSQLTTLSYEREGLYNSISGDPQGL